MLLALCYYCRAKLARYIPAWGKRSKRDDHACELAALADDDEHSFNPAATQGSQYDHADGTFDEIGLNEGSGFT